MTVVLQLRTIIFSLYVSIRMLSLSPNFENPPTLKILSIMDIQLIQYIQSF